MPIKQKKNNKTKNRKRDVQQNAVAQKGKSQKLRTSLDIYNRLLHDKTLDMDLKNVFIGYNNNDAANKLVSETCITSWRMINNGGDIIYFSLTLNDDSKLMIWDRYNKLDRLYASGETLPAQKWIHIKNTVHQKNDVLPVITCINSAIRFIEIHDDKKEEKEEVINAKYDFQLLVGKTTRNKSKFIHSKVSKHHTLIAAISAMVHKWGKLSPFHLSDDNGRLIENIWQFSKVYESIPAQNQIKYGKIKWQYSEVKKCMDDNGVLTEEYWKWREVGMNYHKAVRFPVGRANRFKCLYSVVDQENTEAVSYIEARKKIYIPQYIAALVKCEKFKQLKRMYDRGEYLLISEFDGPRFEDNDYYTDKYKRNDIVLEGNVMIPNKKNLKILLNDAKRPFGHGYCIAMALQGFTVNDLH